MSQPIFIFSAGWRSGSTMVQRMVTASGEALVWGEAGGALDRMADAYFSYEQMLGDGGQRFKFGFGGNGARQFEEFNILPKGGSNTWIACMNPPLDTFTESFREFFDKVYRIPALEIGYQNWGIKEVQSGLDAARFLRVLYPSAKFVFLVRHPFDCLTSIKRRDWLDRPKDRDALKYYGEHWARLAGEFRQADFGKIIKYEELVASQNVQDQLGDYLGITQLSNRFNKLNHADWKSHNEKTLNVVEKGCLSRIAREEMKNYKYV